MLVQIFRAQGVQFQGQTAFAARFELTTFLSVFKPIIPTLSNRHVTIYSVYSLEVIYHLENRRKGLIARFVFTASNITLR